jgi:hypothetical protein
MIEKKCIMTMLHNGYDVQIGRLSINNIDKVLKFSKKKYQVHNAENTGTSEVFEDIEAAVDKFLELKRGRHE